MFSVVPILKVIFSPPVFRNFRNLKWLSIQDCLNLEAVVGKEDEKAEAAANGPLFPKLKFLQLQKLPNFKKFCHMKNDIELPKLESITIEDCQQMETFSPRSLSLPCRENVFGLSDPNLATQIFFNREVKNCSILEEVVREEAEELQAAVMETLFPKLKNLVLAKLSNFKTFCHMKNGIELPKLESILIEDCHKMKTFSLGPLSLPRQFYVFGLLEPDLATQIFLKKEAPRHEIHLENDSFTLSAKDLSGFKSANHYKWCLAKDSSDNFIVVARLPIFPKLRISGRFEMVKLSPRTLYEVAFEIMLEEPRFQLGGLVNLELTSSEGITQEHFEDLKHRPRKEWIEVLAGEFTTGPDPIGDLEFTLYKDRDPGKGWLFSCRKIFFDGLLIKGVIIRRKA